MNERALSVLEFTKVRAMLAAYAVSDAGKAACMQLVPMSALNDVVAAQDETEEATVVLNYQGANPMLPFSDLSDTLARAEKGATLSPKALLTVADTLRAARGVRAALVTDRDNTPRITAAASLLQPLRLLEQDITLAILSEEEIADQASPALADIRRHIRQTNDRVREKLNAMAHGAAFSKYLMEPIVTVRNGRYVLPVKQEYRQQVPGLVHDQSSTGATLFVEPLAVVEMGNELKEWHMKEQAEIERILSALSAQVGAYAPQLAQNVAVLARLDFIFAKGMLARETNAVQPKMNEKGYIRLNRARHPLIDPEKVVPSTLWLGDAFTTLVITGPNTGGKTVTLKTVGLMTLMAQAGLHVPAALGTELSTFREVFADIGDEQSIEQSLSTFSSHMKNIVSMMAQVTPRDLALFDELGAGTDPTEGAALAQAILAALNRQGVRTVATTHYSELKAYALTTPGVENASVEFDVATLRPTYRLSIGVPGKSNAFEISRRLGLSDELIDDAKALLSHDEVRFEDVIANAEYHRQVAEKERQLAEEARQETVQLRQEAEKLYKEMEEKKANYDRKARDDARRVLEKARREAESVLSELKRLKSSAATGDAAALRRQLDKNIDALSEGLGTPANLTAVPKQLRLGDTVDVVSLNARGTVLSLPDAKGEVQLQVGIMKMKARLSDLRLVEEAKKKPARSTVHADTGAATRSISLSCDVRGMNLEEALCAVEQYLDQAVLSGLHEVTIVHGKGTGILRSGIQKALRHYPHVKSCRLGVYGEGEDGVTVVTLD